MVEGGFGNCGIFLAHNYVSEQFSNYVEYGSYVFHMLNLAALIYNVTHTSKYKHALHLNSLSVTYMSFN